ncbi:MAG: O-antigen ligase family protein [Verrucomicrobiales bacterium]|nr:O-antigen ligase family protein [Verrucomicrobiales bacterium]
MLPILFLLLPLDRKQFFWLVVLQLLLTATFLVSDFALSAVPGGMNPLLYFFELSTDAMNFEQNAMSFGIVRHQSLGWFFTSVLYLLFVLFHSREFTGKKAWWLIPTAVGAYSISLLSGSRTTAGLPVLILMGVLWAQRFFDARKLIISAMAGVFLLLLAYGTARQAPMSVQRALCILPGIDVSPQAAADAETTLTMRRMLRRIGTEMISDYLWLGRGFGVTLTRVQTSRFDWALEQHLQTGTFYNGAIGLLVNTGVLGFVSVMLLFYGGTRMAWRVVRHVWDHGAEDPAVRAALLVAFTWIVEVVFFLGFHGDSQQTLRRFGMLIGMLIAADRLIRTSALEETEAGDEVAALPETT